MGCITSCCSSCICGSCCLNSYLHVYIRSVDNLNKKGDLFSFDKAGGDLYVRVNYQGQKQSTRILHDSDHDAVFEEGLIINNCYPHCEGSHTLTFELIDHDTMTGDDVLGVCHIEVPTAYGLNMNEKKYKFIGKEGDVIARLRIDQVHFIHEKLNKYTGPCKIFCCLCCNTGMCTD